MFKVTFSVGCA